MDTDACDLITFTSRSCVTGFVQSQKRENFAGVNALCIGEQTAEEAGKYGFEVIVSDRATIESMETVDYLRKNASSDETVCVAASGDTGFYSIASTIGKNLPEGVEAEFLCGISSMDPPSDQVHRSADQRL